MGLMIDGLTSHCHPAMDIISSEVDGYHVCDIMEGDGLV